MNASEKKLKKDLEKRNRKIKKIKAKSRLKSKFKINLVVVKCQVVILGVLIYVLYKLV